MTLTINKLGAAESQLKEAIRLFFEERDPVSIHTLASAALQILHDHFDEEGIRKHQLLFHPKYISNKTIVKQLRKASNFFKHAEKDIEAEIEFDPKDSEFDIAAAIRCIKKIKGTKYTFSIAEFHAFDIWFGVQGPFKYSDPQYETFKNHQKVDYLKVIEVFRSNPEIVECMELKD